MPTMQDELVELTRGLYESVSAGDWSPLLEIAAPDVVWISGTTLRTPVPWYGAWTGRDGVRQFIEAARDSGEMSNFQIRSVLASGHQVAVHVVYDVRLRQGAQRLRVEAMHLCTFNGQRQLVQFHSFQDTAQTLSAHQRQPVSV